MSPGDGRPPGSGRGRLLRQVAGAPLSPEVEAAGAVVRENHHEERAEVPPQTASAAGPAPPDRRGRARPPGSYRAAPGRARRRGRVSSSAGVRGFSPRAAPRGPRGSWSRPAISFSWIRSSRGRCSVCPRLRSVESTRASQARRKLRSPRASFESRSMRRGATPSCTMRSGASRSSTVNVRSDPLEEAPDRCQDLLGVFLRRFDIDIGGIWSPVAGRTGRRHAPRQPGT